MNPRRAHFRALYADGIRASEWAVRPVAIGVCRKMVELHHYARGGSNTATYRHGLFRIDDPARCRGIAWWIPPTKSAAEATYPEDWEGVLALSRLAIEPGVPKNAATFLLARSRALIDSSRWPCLVTYADEWQGHDGGIYRQDGWDEVGRTDPEPTFIRDGQMVSRKRGQRTLTRAEMEAEGAKLIGSFARIKFVRIERGRPLVNRRQSELAL